MSSSYMEAVEKRLEWLRWGNSRAGNSILWNTYGQDKFKLFDYTLNNGPTYFMDKHFCQLVDRARRDMPDDIIFDPLWMVTPYGWMWLEEPFEVPDMESKEALIGHPLEKISMTIKAIGWRKLEDTVGSLSEKTGERDYGPDRYWFCCFVDFKSVRTLNGLDKNRDLRSMVDTKDPKTGKKLYVATGLLGGSDSEFGAWSYFTVSPNGTLMERMKKFEDEKVWTSKYEKDVNRPFAKTHEMRWIYTAMYLMSQRLTMRVRRETSRAVKKRALKNNQEAPSDVQIVTLRRKEQDRQKENPNGKVVDWQWQWFVEHFWRHQWYPNEARHKWIFIETFIKGPKDKPIKPIPTKVFIAKR